jgi:hypothetical protein
MAEKRIAKFKRGLLKGLSQRVWDRVRTSPKAMAKLREVSRVLPGLSVRRSARVA